jgi:hypothetical protein
VLLGQADAVRVEHGDQPLDRRIPLLLADLHRGVEDAHLAPAVLARPAGRGAHEVDQIGGELGDVAVGEAELDPIVGAEAGHEVAGHRLDRRFPAEPIVQAALRGGRRGPGARGLLGGRSAAGGRDEPGDREQQECLRHHASFPIRGGRLSPAPIARGK